MNLPHGRSAPLVRFKKRATGNAETALVCLQHLLPSIEYLFQRVLEQTGIPPSKIFVIGKPYSTVSTVVKSLHDLGINVFVPEAEEFEPGNYAEDYDRIVRKYWSYVLSHTGFTGQRLIVLDEGGNLRRSMPEEVSRSRRLVMIEHTSSGVPRGAAAAKLAYPLILLARSFAKTRFESPYIAKAIVQRLDQSLYEAEGMLSDGVRPLLRKRIGIVGLGHLGSTVAQELALVSGAMTVHATDVNDQVFSDPRNRGIIQSSKSELVQHCDVILGCTGHELVDIEVSLFGTSNLRTRGTRSVARSNESVRRKYFGSCSSGDREFLSLIRRLRLVSSIGSRRNTFSDSRGQVGECDVTLLNGGFPLNFDRQTEFEPFDRIRLTRELTLMSVVQATFMLERPNLQPLDYRLNPQAQMQIVGQWVAQLKEVNGLGDASGPALWRGLGIPFDPPHLLEQWVRSEGKAFEEEAFAQWLV